MTVTEQEYIIGKKNAEMWKEYKEIDPRVIRPVDGTEFFVSACHINLMDVFPKISTEEFKKRAEKELSKIELFNLAFKRINGHLFYIRKPFEMHIEEKEYSEDDEVENYLKYKDDTVYPYEPIFPEDDKDVQLLIHFKIWQLKTQTKIFVSVNHAISDGRTIFNIMDYIRQIVNGKSIEPNTESLPDFGGLDRYKNLDDSFFESPKNWSEVTTGPVIPISDPPYNYIRPHMIFDYKPVQKFIHENGITIQAMLMAATSRAVRRYNKMPKETPLWNQTTVDTRASPYATDEYKKRKLYCNVGFVYIKLVGQETLMEDLKHCMAQLKAALKRSDDVRQLAICSTILDSKTLNFVPKAGLPTEATHSCFGSSNIGKVKGNIPLITSSNNPRFFVFGVSSYHTEDKLYVPIARPYGYNEEFINMVKEEINKVFIPENISKY